MPNNTIYWYGFKGTGYSNPSTWPGQTSAACTENTTYVNAQSSGSTSFPNIGRNNMNACTKAYAILDNKNGTSNWQVPLFITANSSGGGTGFQYNYTTTTGLQTISADYISSLGSKVDVSVGASNNAQAYIYALWYE